nr:retrovirus-related Pol polyprotein from transposon TNT 1-94 [Tanacetum cinerariifolium]
MNTRISDLYVLTSFNRNIVCSLRIRSVCGVQSSVIRLTSTASHNLTHNSQLRKPLSGVPGSLANTTTSLLATDEATLGCHLAQLPVQIGVSDVLFIPGYVFTIGNSVVSWKAALQPSVALCTIKAEYMALTEAAKEGIWLKGLIEDLGFPQDQATVFCDSMSAICLAKDQVYHDQTKHIDARYHFIRSERRIKVKKIGIKDNPVDLLNIDNWKYGVT